MLRLYQLRPVRSKPLPAEKHAAKLIELRVRREARLDRLRDQAPNRPDAA